MALGFRKGGEGRRGDRAGKRREGRGGDRRAEKEV